MKKSKYYHYIKVNENIVAVFNSLILDITYITRDEFNLLENENYNLIEKNKLIEI